MKSWIVRVQPKHILAISDVLQLLHSEGYSGEVYNNLSDTLEDLKFNNNVDNALNEANALHTGDKEPLSPENDLEQARRTR